MLKRLTLQSTYQFGFTLIEVLVAMLVLLVGLLGVLSMQLDSFQNSRSALYRNQAAIIAEDFVDRVRGNAAGLAAGHYDSVAFTAASTIPTAVACVAEGGCSAVQQASYDQYQWARNFIPSHPNYTAALPAAQGQAGVDTLDAGGVCGASIKYDVVVEWEAVAGDSDGQVRVSACLAN